MAIDPKIVAELKEKHPALKLFQVGSIIVKRPGPVEYRKFKVKGMTGGAARADATEELVRDCLVYPDQAAFTAMVNDQPALVDVLVDRLLDLAGVAAKDLEVVPL